MENNTQSFEERGKIEVVDIPKTSEVSEIDINNVLQVKNDDGTIQNYILILDESDQVIMTPLVDVIDSNPPVENETKLIKIKDELVKIVPIQEYPSPAKRRHVVRKTKKHLPKVILAKEISENIADSSDILKLMDLAPRTKKEMQQIDNFVKLFSNPCHTFMGSKCKALFTRNCVTSKKEDTEKFDDLHLLPVGYQIQMDRPNKRISRPRSKDKQKIQNQIEYLSQTESNWVLLDQNNDVEIQSLDGIQTLLQAAETETEHFIIVGDDNIMELDNQNIEYIFN